MAAPYSVTKHWINLSSADRTSGNSNDFNIQFNSGGITNDSGGFFGSKSYINPIFFSFPNNAPNIQDNFNNVFYISGSKFAGPEPYAMLTLPQGVYQNVKQLTTGIQTAINNYISVIHATVLPVAYTGTITVAADTIDSNLTYNKIVFTFNSPGSTETLNFYFSIGTPVNYAAKNPLNFGSVVGTDENIFTLTASILTHTLPYLPNLQIYDIIQIKCNLTRSTYELEYKSGVTTNGILSPSLIMVAFPTANFTVNDSILFSNNNPFLYRQIMNTSNYDSINIQICDKNGRLIPFFGEVDFSITIEREVFNEPVNLTRAKDQSPYSAPMFYQ
jgi:hypothetical protein